MPESSITIEPDVVDLITDETAFELLDLATKLGVSITITPMTSDEDLAEIDAQVNLDNL